MMLPLLLDTCATIWIAAGEISEAAANRLNETRAAGFPVYVSAISAWEIGLLARKGRFKSRYSPQRWFDRLLATPDTALAELTPRILIEACFLPGRLHNDPADRILAATARECGFTVLTRDRALLDYAAQGHLSAADC